jgi:hypothetical protein
MARVASAASRARIDGLLRFCRASLDGGLGSVRAALHLAGLEGPDRDLVERGLLLLADDLRSDMLYIARDWCNGTPLLPAWSASNEARRARSDSEDTMPKNHPSSAGPSDPQKSGTRTQDETRELQRQQAEGRAALPAEEQHPTERDTAGGAKPQVPGRKGSPDAGEGTRAKPRSAEKPSPAAKKVAAVKGKSVKAAGKK